MSRPKKETTNKTTAPVTAAPAAVAAPEATASVATKPAAEVAGIVKNAVKDVTEDLKTVAATVAKKAPVKKAAAKKAAQDGQVFIQYNQREATPESLVTRSQEDWIANGGNEADIKSIRVYVNTNEGMVYYVINDSAGSFPF